MKTSENVNELYSALSKAQSEFPELIKDSSVKVTMKSGGQYSFDFLELEDLIKLTTPALSSNGLSISQGVNETMDLVLTRLCHSSGQWAETFMPTLFSTIDKIDQQKMGANFSYARRYGLQAAIGVCGESDNDCNDNANNTASFEKSKKSDKERLSNQVYAMFMAVKNANLAPTAMVDFFAKTNTKAMSIEVLKATKIKLDKIKKDNSL